MVVFLVPDEKRRERIVDSLAQLPAEHWQLFQVGRLDHAVALLAGDTVTDRGS
jgi:hypothetical protein